MSSIIALAMLSVASGEYMKSLYLGTPCECNVSTTYHTYIYDLKASPHFGDGGECKGESEDPLDVWNGLGVEFYGNAGKSSHYPTFEYTIDCAIPCVIMRVDIGGNGWCSGPATTKLRITGSDANGEKPEKYGEISMGPNPDTKIVEESGTYSCDLGTTGTAEGSRYGVCSITPNAQALENRLKNGLMQRFKIEDTDDICLEGVESGWRCRSSLSIWATTDVDVPAVCGGSCNKTSSSSATSPSDSKDDSTDSKDNSKADSKADSSDSKDELKSDSDGDSKSDSDDSGDSKSDSSDSKDESKSDSKDESKSDSKDDSKSDSGDSKSDSSNSKENSSDSSEDSSEDSKSDSKSDSKDDSSDSKSKSKAESSDSSNSKDDSSDSSSSKDSSDLKSDSSDSKADSGDSKADSSDSKDDSSDSKDDSSDDLNTIALRYEECSSRLKELEAWKQVLLSMTAAKSIQGEEAKDEKDEGSQATLSPSSTSTSTSASGVFGVEEALIVCLVLTNVVLLAYVCRKNMAKHKPVYAGVPVSEQEDVCD